MDVMDQIFKSTASLIMLQGLYTQGKLTMV